jgi:hypothetical protein
VEKGTGMELEHAGQREPSGIRVTAEGATTQELAAILAAVEALWPRPGDLARMPPDPGAWRFSGRWWKAGSFPLWRS